MAKTTKTPAPIAITVPRTDDTKNYAKFALDKSLQSAGGTEAFGSFYLPLDQAKGVTAITVSVVRR
jgi:hypothetical protein